MTLKKLKKLAHAEQTTLEKIDAMLFKQINQDSSGKTPSNKPSSLGYKCYRRLYYTYFRVPEEGKKTAKLAKIFKVGHAFEEMFINWVRQVENFVDYLDPKSKTIPLNREGDPDPQFPIKSDKWKIKQGKIDGVSVSQGCAWLYEVKSANSKNFKEVQKKGQPTDEHLIQGAIYLQTFNDLLKAGEYEHVEALNGVKQAEGIKYYYINKDTCEIEEFCLTLEEMAPVIVLTDKKISTLNNYIQSKTLPPKNEKECFFCPFKTKCQQDWNEV